MSTGSTYKRCKCRDADGRELGAECPQLRRRDGSWNPKHGTWYFRLEVEAGPGGKRRTVRRGGFASEREAAAERDRAREKAGKGVDVAARLTVGAFLAEWLAGKADLSANTRRLYGQHIALYLTPHLGHVELDRLRPKHISEMFEAIERDNQALADGRPVRKSQRHVGPSSMQRIRGTLRAALEDALRQQLVAVNAAKLVKLAAGGRAKARVWTAEREAAWRAGFARRVADAAEWLAERPRCGASTSRGPCRSFPVRGGEKCAPHGGRADRSAPPAAGPRVDRFTLWLDPSARPSPVMVWRPDQTARFLERAAGHRLYALYHLIAFAGLRRGEACGLEWADVDLDAEEITVRTQLLQLGWEVAEGTPKTEGSDATIPIDAGTVAVLRRHRAQQNRERLEWGEAWRDTGKVFTREDGELLHPAYATEQFERLAFEADLPPVRLHDLRHGTATLALAAGVDMKTVSAMLRHSSVKITSDTYTSVLPDVARKAAAAVASMVPLKTASGTDGLPTGSPRRT